MGRFNRQIAFLYGHCIFGDFLGSFLPGLIFTVEVGRCEVLLGEYELPLLLLELPTELLALSMEEVAATECSWWVVRAPGGVKGR